MSAHSSISCPHCQRRLKIEKPELIGKRVKCPGCGERFVLKLERPQKSQVAEQPVPNPTEAASEFPFALPSEAAAGASELERLRQRRRKGRWTNMAVVGGFLVVGIGLILYFTTGPVQQPPVVVQPAPTAPVQQPEPVYSRVELEYDSQLVAKFAPTDGEPVQLLMMPSGVGLVIHFRPVMFWSDDPTLRDVRASFTSELENRLSDLLRRHCQRDPREIEEVTFGVIFGARGTEPQVCSVVRLSQPADLLNEIQGEPLLTEVDDPEHRLRGKDKLGYFIKDERTYAIAPRSLAREMFVWAETPNYEVNEGIAQLLETTDRQRLLTVVGNLNDLRIHLKSFFPEPAQGSMKAILDWLGNEIETLGWSLHPTPYLHTQVTLRPTRTATATTVKRTVDEQLQQLPEAMWKNVCLRLSPQQAGARKLIGRFPAMLKAIQLSTISAVKQQNVILTAVLPAKATPNLALASLLTAREAGRRLNEPAVPTVVVTRQMPDKVVDRLNLPVDAEFNRVPLEQALQYLCDEVGVKLVVDGDALKDAGYTRNMPQTYNLGKVPMIEALAAIVNAYQEPSKEMAVVIDEAAKTLTVTSKKFAEERGDRIFPLPSP